jgi:two-component system, OmpR family, phosphate regulon sensor histidine kinase PhoR
MARPRGSNPFLDRVSTLFSSSPPALDRGPELSADESASETATLLANIPDPVILVDGRLRVRRANEAARAFWPTLDLDRPLSMALRAPEITEGAETAIRTGQSLILEHHERVPTERTFEVHLRVLTSAGREDRPDLLLFFRDFTSTKSVERIRADFVANASHELRTPLASLLGFIETLQGRARDDAVTRARFLEIMHEQALRMSRLIENLLSLSRIESRVHLHPTIAVDLLSIVREAADSLSALARERGVEVFLDGGNEPRFILGDRDELIRLVENLIDNALKYGQSGQRVEVALTPVPGDEDRPARVELRVRDFGPGIPADHLPRLTERFYRANVAENLEKTGTGLGIAIVKHIVARHRGRLDIKSEPRQGATFTATFPQAPARPEPQGRP